MCCQREKLTFLSMESLLPSFKLSEGSIPAMWKSCHQCPAFHFKKNFSPETGFLCSPGCPGTHSVDQAGLKPRNPPASASQVLGLKACAITAQLLHSFYVWFKRFVLLLNEREKKRTETGFFFLFFLFSPFNESLILHCSSNRGDSSMHTLYNVNTASIKHQLRKAKE